jgi:sugar phosphate isomerase/epimerase/protein-tyrosine-phosphatase
MQASPPRVLFVCTGNAGRSQMAQRLFRELVGEAATVLSAGVDPWEDLHPVAVQLLHERSLDTREQYPKHVRTMTESPVDVVVTIGDPARDNTPCLAGNPRRVHWDIGDPADADDTPQQEAVFRRTMARIEERLPDLRDALRRWPRASALHLQPGISTNVVRPGQLEPATHLPLIADAGFRCIELNCCIGSADFAWDRPAAVRELKQTAMDTGLAIYSVHAASCDAPLPGKNRWDRFGLDLTKAYIDLAVDLGAQVVVVHSRPVPEDNAEEHTALLTEAFAELQEFVLPLPCIIAWENLSRGLTADAHLAQLQALNPGAFGFVLDTGHAHIPGNTDEFLAGCGQRLCDLHLHDNNGNADSHLLPGEGTFPWRGFIEKLTQTGYTGPLMLEVEDRSRVADLPRYLAAARASVEMLLREG